VHFHCDAWNTIAYGSKRWFLSPPAHAIFSKKPINQWLEQDYPVSAHDLLPSRCFDYVCPQLT
jgi:hypothetical protein